MKDRLTTLVTAIAALLLAIFLLTPPAQETAQPVSLPTSEDRGDDGLKGLYKWLQSQDIPVFSLRKRFTSLTKIPELEASGNLLIISMPQHRQALKTEWQELSSWLAHGNSLLILSAIYSKPDWAEDASCLCQIDNILDPQGWNLESLKDEVEPEFESVEQDSGKEDTTLTETIESLRSGIKAFTPTESTLNPLPKITVLDSVTTVQAKITPALLEEEWYLNAKKQGSALRLLAYGEDQSITTLWQINNLSDSIYLSLLPDLFANEMLNKADNADLIANIIAQNLGQGGRVIFDDYHFGLSDLYDPDRFFSDPRLHQTIAFIGLLWLLYVVAYTNRLAPVRLVQQNPSTVDFVEAMAGFFTHRLHKRTLAQELVKHLIRDVRRQRHFHDNDETWRWLHDHVQLQTAQISLLERAYRQQKTALEPLTNTITHIRKTLRL